MRAIDVKELTVQFGGIQALDHVSFHVNENEALAIVGPNGAGKSTLLNAVNGVVRPSSGTVRLLGQETQRMRAHHIARIGVHRGFQHPHLLETETVLANVMLGGHSSSRGLWLPHIVRPLQSRRREEQLSQQCLGLLEAAQLRDAAEDMAGSTSYGVKKLIDIIRALVGNPKIVLLDEPSSGMGEQDRAKLISLLQWIRQSVDTTLVLVEHHMDVVVAVADRVLALSQGVVAADARVSEVADLESLGLVEPEDNMAASVGSRPGLGGGS